MERKDIFISYSSLDQDFVGKLAEDLRSRNIQVWLDRWDIPLGGNIVEEINRGLENSDQLLVVLSERSVKSKWVEKEWAAKFGEEVTRGKVMVIPAILGDLEREAIPLILRDKKAITLSGNYDDEVHLLVQHLLKRRWERIISFIFDDKLKKSMTEECFRRRSRRVLICKSILKRLRKAVNFPPERKIQLILREILFECAQDDNMLKEINKDAESNPTELNVLHALMQLDVNKEQNWLRRKFDYIAGQDKPATEILMDMVFELEFLTEEARNNKPGSDLD